MKVLFNTSERGPGNFLRVSEHFTLRKVVYPVTRIGFGVPRGRGIGLGDHTCVKNLL